MTAHKNNVWAEFLGYQRDLQNQPYPLFNIFGDHPKAGSTVDANTLIREGIPVPVQVAPSLREWKKKIQ